MMGRDYDRLPVYPFLLVLLLGLKYSTQYGHHQS